MILQKDNKKVTLKTINENLLRAGKSLLEINEQKKQCLQEFLHCKELVKWLQESLKGLSLYYYLKINILFSLWKELLPFQSLIL